MKIPCNDCICLPICITNFIIRRPDKQLSICLSNMCEHCSILDYFLTERKDSYGFYVYNDRYRGIKDFLIQKGKLKWDEIPLIN